MDEQVFLSAQNIKVTSSRIDINGQTFAVRNIGSVKVTTKGVSVLMVIFGAFFVIAGLPALFDKNFGVALFLFGIGGVLIAAVVDRARRRRLVLVTGGGEVTAYESTNGAFVEQLRSSIADAIAVR